MATDVDQTAETTRVAREYFEAVGRAERDAQQRYYADDAQAHVHGVVGPTGRAGMAAFFAELFDAFPDWRFTVVETVAEGDGVAVRWRARGDLRRAGQLHGLRAQRRARRHRGRRPRPRARRAHHASSTPT